MCIIRPQPSISAIPVINPDSIRPLSFSPFTTIFKYLRLQSIYPIPIWGRYILTTVNVSLINFIRLILKQSSKSSSTTIHFHFINFRGRTPLHTLPVNCTFLSYQSPSTFLFYGSVSAVSYVLERVVLVCSFARL